jgi:hopanoid-associated phosphorylase
MVTGMAKELKLAGGPGIEAIASGGSTQGLRDRLAARASPGCRAVVSFGIAGGLDPELVAGDVVVATGVTAAEGDRPADPQLSDTLADMLRRGGVDVRRAAVAGVDRPMMSAAAKAAAHRATGAAVVDMESHVAAAFAARHGLRFAALRIVCDPAGRSLPSGVAAALRPDGSIDHLAFLGELIRRPGQLAGLPRLAAEARTAFRRLGRCRDLLGIGRGLPDLLELLGDVA